MSESSQNFNNLQERNKQVLDNISNIQKQEKRLYDSLDDVTLTSEEKQQIINRINEMSQIRVNMYSSMKDMYSFYQNNMIESRGTLAQEIIAIDILENELNESKKRINLITEQKNNNLRSVEINTYYGKKYSAYTKFMKTIIFFCIPLIILGVLKKKEIVPQNIYGFLTGIIIIIAIIILWNQFIDISNRDEMNWDEYNWNFDSSKAPSDSTEGTSYTNPWYTPSITCVGAACCYDGSSYDSQQNICIPIPIDEQVIESFKGLDKYGYSQVKTTTNTLHTNTLPTFASITKKLFK